MDTIKDEGKGQERERAPPAGSQRKVLECPSDSLSWLDNPTQGKIKAGRGSSTENGKERLRQTLLSGNFSKRQSSCLPCCPLVKYRQYLYSWSSTGSTALAKACDFTHGQSVFKYISWWRSSQGNVLFQHF